MLRWQILTLAVDFHGDQAFALGIRQMVECTLHSSTCMHDRLTLLTLRVTLPDLLHLWKGLLVMHVRSIKDASGM